MGRTAEYKHRKRLIGSALWLAGALLSCATAGAAPVYTLKIDSAASYVDPDPFYDVRYGISGTFEISSFEPSAWSSANVSIRPIEIFTDPALVEPFAFPDGVDGRWQGTAIEFSSNSCAFSTIQGTCWWLGDLAFASGTFDGEHLELVGYNHFFFTGFSFVDYRIVADVLQNAQVPEPTTLSLMLVGLAFAALRIRKRARVSGGLAVRHAPQPRTRT